MRHKATPAQSKLLIEEDNQVKDELMASSDGRYPTDNLHDLRHITDKESSHYGKELLDPTPIEVPAQFKRPKSMLEQMRDQIRIAKLTALDQIQETEEDADDYDVDEDMDPTSRWENDFEPSFKELRANRTYLEQQLRAAEAAQSTPPVATPGAAPLPQAGGAAEVLVATPGETPSSLPTSPKTPPRPFFGR